MSTIDMDIITNEAAEPAKTWQETGQTRSYGFNVDGASSSIAQAGPFNTQPWACNI